MSGTTTRATRTLRTTEARALRTSRTTRTTRTISLPKYLSTPQDALTTIFTPPASCGNFIDEMSWLKESSLRDCYPPLSYFGGWVGQAYYSPGICPAGYKPGCTRLADSTASDQGPPVSAGETAVICCPNSFSCAGDVDDCVSRGPSGTETALSVQIRWQSSDLSVLETPPLQLGLPTSSRHIGQDPESSLVFPYTFPPECSTRKDTTKADFKKSCAPLTGDYYSPAICPSGWTAAWSRESTGAGPPVEADETAMMCCPSGMTSIPGACLEKACLSATVITRSNAASLSVVRWSDPIQIRWASSDLTVLETHPLTPGYFLPRPTVTIAAIPAPNTLYTAGLAVGVLPLLLTLLVASIGGFLLYMRRKIQRNGQMSKPATFKPKVLSGGIILMLIGFMISVIIWIELSCRILPRSDDASQFINSTLSEIDLPKNEIRSPQAIEPQLPLGVTTYTDLDMTCTFPASSSSTRRVTRTSGSSSKPSRCTVSGLAVAFPSCTPPNVGAPKEEKWLGAKQTGREHSNVIREGSTNGAFFIANVLPTLLASLFSIPWKLMQLHALSLEPFHRLSKPGGTTLSATVFGKYSGLSVIKAPITFLTTGLVLLSSCVTVLSSVGWSLGLAGVNGVCKGKDNAGCAPFVQVTREVVHAITGLLALMVVLAITLAVWSRFWTIKVRVDPRSIFGVASLFQSRGLRGVFGLLDPTSALKEMETKVGRTEVRLNTDPASAPGSEYGIVLAEQSQGLQYNAAYKLNTTVPTLQDQGPKERMPVGRIGFQLGLLALFLSGLLALIVYYVVATDREDGFERFMSGQAIGPRVIFATCGVIINYGWVETFALLLPLAPYYALSTAVKSVPNADSTILAPYSSDPFSSLMRSIRTRNMPIACVALFAIVSEFLPLLLANVPFNRTTTIDVHKISSWLTVAIMVPMIVTALLLLSFLIKNRPRHRVNVGLLRKAPLAATLLLLHRSEELLHLSAEVANGSAREQEKEVRKRALRYGIVSRGGEDAKEYYSSVYIH